MVDELGADLGIPKVQRHKIKTSASSDEEHLHTIISTWLQSSGIASWRLLIWGLDRIGAMSVADKLKPFTEPLRGTA